MKPIIVEEIFAWEMEKLLPSLHVCDEILFLLHENKNKLRFVLTIHVFS